MHKSHKKKVFLKITIFWDVTLRIEEWLEFAERKAIPPTSILALIMDRNDVQK
jgi:hypothetical protein